MHNNTANKSKVLSSKTVYQSTNFRVQQEEIERDGHVFVKDIIEDASTVIVLPYTKNGEIYLAREYRDALGKMILNTIGGKLDKDEALLTAAKRELEEEVGLKANVWKQVATWERSAVGRKKVHVFFATDIEEGTQRLDDDENIELVKFSVEDAVEKIIAGEIDVEEDVAAILLFDKLLREGMNVPHTE